MSACLPVDVLLSEEHPAAVMLVEHGRVVAANAAAGKLFGPQAAVGIAVASCFEDGSHRKLATALAARRGVRVELQTVAQAGEPQVVLLLVEPLGGQTLLLALRVGPEYDQRAEHTLLQVNASLVNVTRELAQRGAELASAKAELERLADLREASVATLSHDIRSPLTAITFLTSDQERRASRLTPEEVADRARSIDRNAKRVLHMVDELLDLARLDANEVMIQSQPVALASVAADVLDSVAPIAAASAVRLELAASATVRVKGDATRLFEVVANLVNNAIRHSPRGGVVRVSIEDGRDVVRCFVRDEGPGVPAPLRSQLFDRFRQGAGHVGSAGLGLYITRRIVQMHGGRIWLEETGLPGASFAFELPALHEPNDAGLQS
jgi:two-component system sensor histidine kinase BaeS